MNSSTPRLSSSVPRLETNERKPFFFSLPIYRAPKPQAAQASERGTASPPAEMMESGERQERLRTFSSELLYWKGGLKVLKQARLPKWRGYFRWQIEAQIEALQAAYATLRAEAANEGE